ncbi:MAG: hypothetical protein A3J46_06475 [Candidatus Yanofskybacteria bacterium RIFCSPHIGHO2_02_FULL_41_11]|uniref:Uncharacterized protein n=1 Tax=Candidatus Yanofskybacteria bacterium RIFCSPHIGHO2_02_FULL_41_11 TaxID=1802675 RepID=A0A1F8F6N3_9BACT|nr:MAG: hypothetical protein A3J46_06475 [Candidatus Yanofskybacteria bacterium RIFCSPHIGHO2_02_FULL_41_11]
MNSFRKGRSPEEMSSEEVKQYKVLQEEWHSKKEVSMNSWDALTEDKQQELAAMGSRLYDVQARLVLLRPKEAPKSEPETSEAVALGTAVIEEEKETVQPVSEKPESELSLADNELKERQEAEANPDQTPPKGFMQRVRDAFDKAKASIMDANRISGGSETVEDRMFPLGLRKEPLAGAGEKTAENEEQSEPTLEPESTEPVPASKETPKEVEPEAVQPEQEPKKATAWSFIKERAKGFITPFGFREFRQAEILRRRTGEISGDTEALATRIQQERNLSLEEAQSEANELVQSLENAGIKTPSAADYETISQSVTERKRKENDEEITYIVKSTENDIYDKLQKYRGQAGQDVLTRENQLAIRADLMGTLNKLRDGASRKDFVNYAKLIRRNLDSKWGRRYVWGGIDAALWLLGIAVVSMKFMAGKEAAAVGAKVAAGGAGSAEAAREFVETGMHKNIWSTLEQMAKNGPAHMNATGAQLKEWSQATLDAIKHYEPEWMDQMVEGLKSSRTMPEGFPLKVPVEVMKSMGY